MKKFLNQVLQNHNFIYKAILYVITVVLIVFLFPKGGKFKYDYLKGQPWKYDNFYAPFDFAIQKSDEEISEEKLEITEASKKYYKVDATVEANVKAKFREIVLSSGFPDELIAEILQDGNSIIHRVYKRGFVDASSEAFLDKSPADIILRKGTVVSNMKVRSCLRSSQLLSFISDQLKYVTAEDLKHFLMQSLAEVIQPNIFYDEAFTNKVIDDAISKISYTKGLITESELIILKGDIVEGEKLAALDSIKRELESQVWSKSNYLWILTGYSVLVALVLLMLLLFLRKYRREIYDDNSKNTLIFINILLMVFLVTFIIQYEANYVYAIPLCALPIILKAFFDARLGLFAHVLTILILGFVVPNSFEFIFLQIIAGIVTILTVSELYKRVNLFISISQIVFIYMITYVAFTLIQEGNLSSLNLFYFGLFALNGMLAFLATMLIFVYERVFGLISDISLLELSNTNSKLLKELAEKAPGTFQHSMQVANLAEAAADEIGANPMLIRTGALYHDIGKMKNPMYFTENQSTNVNPHNEVSSVDSAEIIINHIIDGIELAKKHRLPDRIIDFIRTHHGTSLVYYFYAKEKEENPDTVDIEKFRYPGPNPFSKETAILMMCDSVEAASKSLKEPSAQSIDDLVDKIISKQMEEGQFMNADITFKDIELIKKVLKKKLKNIYHLRIEYPE